MYTFQPFELEPVNFCPICNSSHHHLAYEEVPDILSNAAPGRWAYAKCVDCGSLYLAVRPRENCISRAYESYYTHHANGIKHYLKRFLLAAYIRSMAPTAKASLVRRFLGAMIFAPISGWCDSKTRHLRIYEEPIGNLLDVGCGNGDFLDLAKLADSNGFGTDFDLQAVNAARSRGLNVSQETLDRTWTQMGGVFDLITAGHVLEHLYHPNEFFSDCHRALRAGGYLWIQVPNADSRGLEIYSKYWRGLEAPRHISIPSMSGLKRLASAHGFEVFASPVDRSAAIFTGIMSARAQSRFSKDSKQLVRKLLLQSAALLMPSQRLVKRQEFLTIILRKVSSS